MNPAIARKIVELDALPPILERLRAQGKRIVQCHGCFDVVHPGHVRHLADAASQGDVLVVSVTADPQIAKREGRPFVPQELRCENLAALSMVDYVVLDTQSWAGPLLEKTRPDVYVKGLEYSTNNDPRFLKEKEIVEKGGGVVVYTSGAVVYSSTRLQRDYLDQDELNNDRVSAYLSRHGLTADLLENRLRALQDQSVVIVGDAVIDHYVECEQGETSTEAPILQVSPIDERSYLGGACVLALHAASLGAKTTYVGFLPTRGSNDGLDIRATLESGGVNVLSVGVESTLVKTRYLVEGQKVFKVNRCRPLSISTAGEDQWLKHLSSAMAGDARGVIGVDFGYGALTRPRMRKAAQIIQSAGGKLYGDTSSTRTASLGKFHGASCEAVFPSESEARAYLGEPELGLPLLASKLFSQRIAGAVALTLGPRGLVLFERNRQSADVDGSARYLPEYLPTLAPHAVDPLGAGDALTTVASLALLADATPVEAVLLGSVAAAIAVGRLGNEPIGLDPMLRFLRTRPPFRAIGES